MVDGFLGTRASLMLDVVCVALVLIVPALGLSVYLVKYRRRYALHKRIQLVLALALLVAVVLFELEMRIYGWEHRAEGSPYLGADGGPNWVMRVLWLHLVFAVTTAALWIAVTVQALRKFPDPPLPGPHSRWHLRWGKLAALDMLATAVTGWIFYYLAFVAK